jgi:hypothetical protein
MCDFENEAQPICSWSHDNDADFNWARVRGDEVNELDLYDDLRQTYGPDFDHTLGKKNIILSIEENIFISINIGTSDGHFLLLDTNLPRQPNDTARVVSPVFAPTTSQKCQFRFWYHMYGYDVAGLNVYTRTYIGGPLTRVWNQQSEQGDEWFRATVVLQVQQPFQILIEGVRGISSEGI